jgi:hypothetical protein
MIIYTLLFATMLSTTPVRLICPQSERRSIIVNGIISEWDQLNGLKLSDADIIMGKRSGKTDLQVEIKCSYVKKEGLYFLIEVTDSRINRSRRPTKDGDHFILSLIKKKNKIVVYPPSYSYKGKITGVPKGAKAKVVKLKLGYALEIGFPWKSFGIIPDVPMVPINLSVYDRDSSVAKTHETIMSLDKVKYPKMTSFEYYNVHQMYTSVMEKLNLDDSDVKQSKVANFLSGKRLERAIFAGKYLAVIGGDIGNSFFYTALGNSGNDIKNFKILNINGSKTLEFLSYSEISTDSFSYKVLYIWALNKMGIKKIFGHFVEFKSGDHFLKNSYKLKKKGKRYCLYFKYLKASKSITKKNWKGLPKGKVTKEFIFPWSKKKKQIFCFKGAGFTTKLKLK